MSSSTIPDAFVRRLHAHNFRVIFFALFYLLATIFIWFAIYFAIKFLFIAFYSVTDGVEAALPSWFRWVFPAVAFSITIFSIIVRMIYRYPRLRDRPILGLHVLWELFLLPATLTFGISDSLHAWQPLSKPLIRQAWQILNEIYRNGKIYQSMISGMGGSPASIQAACLLLQFAGLISLHHGEEDWFYLIPVSEKDFLQSLLPDITPPP
ncbi:MAG: hypothetical protein ACK5NG_02095 [Chthoniobacterales bacterium]